ncbi:amino-acid N-acetyltransferase, partial [Leptospirillum ferriphilum]
MSDSMHPENFIRGFRESSPYIHRFRGKTFVIVFGGEVVADGSFMSIASDIALLRSLGIGVVLVCGADPQIDERLKNAGIPVSRTWAGPVVSREAVPDILRAVGEVRFSVEAALSRGVTDSPMSGAEVRVAGGNLVVSRPLGVIDGVDHHFYGTPRHIRGESVRRFLDDGMVVLLPPLGVSLSGDMFLLSPEDVAQETAIALSASKVLFLVDEPILKDLPQGNGREFSDRDVALLLSGRSAVRAPWKTLLERASKMIGAGVERVHFVDRHRDGALLLELFTRDGCGILVSSDPFEEIRPAAPSDVPGILDLIRPLETKGILVDRTR